MALVEAERNLEEFINTHQEFYEAFRALITKRNQLLEDAVAQVRALDTSCGPIQKISESVKINAEKLFEELGADAFKELGGYTETVTDYKVDRTRFLAYLTSGTIPPEVEASCVNVEKRYKKPDPYKIP